MLFLLSLSLHEGDYGAWGLGSLAIHVGKLGLNLVRGGASYGEPKAWSFWLWKREKLLSSSSSSQKVKSKNSCVNFYKETPLLYRYFLLELTLKL